MILDIKLIQKVYILILNIIIHYVKLGVNNKDSKVKKLITSQDQDNIFFHLNLVFINHQKQNDFLFDIFFMFYFKLFY